MTSAELERFTGGVAVGVDVAAIERDLVALWRQAAKGHKAVTRACAWNLVVHVESDATLERGKAMADALVERGCSAGDRRHRDGGAHAAR